MQDRWGPRIAAFAALQAADALACAKLDYIQKDLDRIDCPPSIRRMLPYIKASSAAGLILGRRWPRLGRVTAIALSAYFVCAVGFHVRARDPIWRALPAASLVAFCLALAGWGYQVPDEVAIPGTGFAAVDGPVAAPVITTRDSERTGAPS